MAEDRRTLLKVLTGLCGTGAAAVVGGPALRMLVSPLTMRPVTGAGDFAEVIDLAALPEDGTPVRVPVIIEAPRDAWTKLPPTEVGAVFVARRDGKPIAWSTICPHLGCGIDFDPAGSRFACPCHESFFDSEGEVASGPSPRGMDTLETQVVDGRVRVKFEKFEIGKAEKVVS